MPFTFQPALRVPQQPHKRSHSNDSFVAGWVGRVHMPLTPFLQSLRTTTWMHEFSNDHKSHLPMEGVDQDEKQEFKGRSCNVLCTTNIVCRSRGVKQRVEFKSCKRTLYRLLARFFWERYQLHEGRDWVNSPCPFNAGKTLLLIINITVTIITRGLIASYSDGHGSHET